MTTTTLHIEVDEDIKNKAVAALADRGLSVAELVRALLSVVATEKTVPAALKIPNAETLAAMREVELGDLPRFHSVQELFDELEKE
ncbi:MAG: type II toxin-antitoxin system RelB/DinJ family antitoxin [Methylococcales bacterium]